MARRTPSSQEDSLSAELKRLRVTFENAAVGISHVALDGRWLRVNQRLCAIVGYSEEELHALTFGDITHPDDLEADWAEARRLLQGEISHYQMMKRYFRKEGRIVWINLTVSLARKANGDPDYFISVIEDITQRRQIEEDFRASEERLRLSREALRQANEDLEQRVAERTWELVQANRELREQMAERVRLERAVLQISEHERRGMGQDIHDGLCQELTGIACLVQALSSRLGNRGLADEASELAEVAGMLSNAATEARDVARGLHPVELDSEGLVSALYELAEKTGRRLPCQFRSLDTVVILDNAVAQNLYRIAQEAVNNAIKHAEATALTLSLSGRNGVITLEICDDGCGLKDREGKSPGMGLRLMNYRADTIGGSFSVKTRPEGGTQVRCVVPLNGADPFRPAPME